MVYSIRSPLSLTYILYMLDLSLSVSADDRRIMYKYWRESHERGRLLAPRQDFSSEFPAILQWSTYLAISSNPGNRCETTYTHEHELVVIEWTCLKCDIICIFSSVQSSSL